MESQDLVGSRPARQKKPSERDSIVAEIHRRFVQQGHAGIPKYVQLRTAIQVGIEEGILAPGDQIPPEDRLTSALGISLGTVRRALGYLAAGGFVNRQHGRGTFIAKHLQAIEDSWHYRFVAADGKSLLPVYSHVIDRGVIKDPGPWADALGADKEGYVRIKRCFNIDNKFLSYSEFYLGHTRFGRILQLPLSSLEDVNLKKILSAEANAPTVYVQQRVRVERFSEEVSDLLSVGKRTNGLFLEIVAHTYDDSPISYHMIYIPPTKYMLDLSAHERATRAVASVG